MGVFALDIEGSTLALPVRGLSRLDWSLLCDEHPGRTWGSGTFPAALIAACTDLTSEQGREAWDEWPPSEAEALFSACVEASMPGSWQWAVDRLTTNGRLAVEVRVASRMGIPHSVFAAWSDRDQDLALASFELAEARCPGCSAPEAAMTDPSKAEIVVRSCWMCRAKAAAQSSIPEGERGSTHVMIVPVRAD